ncbi:DUF2950 family protein [Aurantimonas endophytica]|uniref:DUF2950 family protein n=1 Tax=Aurantimonas endophytica TaxID=1522175 RepID=A0A7W6HI63_9HYPH|nr:DUF2950 family protein [Aurantimonas endophytica]MBB4005647.1 hypothetical protein [Aurantimonas endophytica]MCO6406399.1 DUF2950 family protein [Aurantimonas endophytica]
MNVILYKLHTTCIAALTVGLAGALPALTRAQEPDQATRQAAPEGIFAFEAEDEPPLFDDAAPAIDALKKALADNDFDGLAKLLGLDVVKLKEAEGVTDTFVQIRNGAAKQVVVEDIENGKLLQIGEKLWPFPFPLLKGEDGKWAFDTQAGLEEIVNRRVGENELEAIATMRAYVEAQKDYAGQDRDGDGVEEFAQKLISTEGTTDGLYWPADDVNDESPAGDLSKADVDDAAQGDGYFGYRFKILTGQGDRIAGGAYDYVINGNMIGGFALIAWPVRYTETGVHTFAVNQHGIIYEADLGPATETIVKYINRFDPDDSWSVAD